MSVAAFDCESRCGGRESSFKTPGLLRWPFSQTWSQTKSLKTGSRSHCACEFSSSSSIGIKCTIILIQAKGRLLHGGELEQKGRHTQHGIRSQATRKSVRRRRDTHTHGRWCGGGGGGEERQIQYGRTKWQNQDNGGGGNRSWGQRIR